MTGYGSAESAGPRGRFRAELRGINSRYLEIRAHLPSVLTPFEADFRKRIGESFRRGRLDLTLTWAPAGEAPAPIALNTGVARAYLEAADRLQKDLGIRGDLGVVDVLGLPGVVEMVRPEGMDSEMKDLALEAVEAAVREAGAMRHAEGEVLERDIRTRIEALDRLMRQIASRATLIPAAMQKRLQDRLARLGVDASLDPSRLAQEVAYLADRSDIAEELTRLEAHLARCREVLARDDQPAGKTLEFLTQELHRETNTIGSKSTDAGISGLVLEMKSEIERVREQVLNLE